MTISMKRLLSGAAALALVTIPMSAQAAERAAEDTPPSHSSPEAPSIAEPPLAPEESPQSKQAEPSNGPADSTANSQGDEALHSSRGSEQTGSGNNTAEPAETTQSRPAQDPALTPIPEIQKTGDADDSALIGTTVTTLGVVTGAYPKSEDGLASTLDGFTIQTPGSGGTWDPARGSSDGLFVWVGKKNLDIPAIGSCVQVRGTVTEFPATGKTTPASTPSLTQLAVTAITPAMGCAPVFPTPLDSLPNAEQFEALESMLVAPSGSWTITDNYQVNQYGTLALTPGSEPLRAATDVVAPGGTAIDYEAKNAAAVISLDDGTNTNLTQDVATSVPYAYIANGAPARVGYQVNFTHPVLVDVRHSNFVFQPSRMVAGHPDRSPVAISGQRPEVPTVSGDVKVATFNVLNYFSDLGENEPGCKGYPDREGNFVTTKKCTVRGAWSSRAFSQQQSKIVTAITMIDADVVALEEIENPVGVGIGPDRDAALKTLVDVLNAAAGSRIWAFVPSPGTVPAKEDVIRTAFIYKPKTVTPVGQSQILDDPAFTGLARQPLAQEFAPVVTDQQIGKNFVVIANHFKSKGSIPKGMEEGNTDIGDGQGNSNAIRVAQARALALFAAKFEDRPTLLVGDFNSYSKEEPLTVLKDAGWIHKSEGTSPSYVYQGRSGSLDHVFANTAADPLVVDIASWAVNAEESVAFEYSRSNANLFLKTEMDNPYRSSDHNPEIVGLKLVSEKPGDGGSDPGTHTPNTPADPGAEQPPSASGKGASPAGESSSKGPGSLASTGTHEGLLAAAGISLLLAAALAIRRARIS